MFNYEALFLSIFFHDYKVFDPLPYFGIKHYNPYVLFTACGGRAREQRLRSHFRSKKQSKFSLNFSLDHV